MNSTPLPQGMASQGVGATVGCISQFSSLASQMGRSPQFTFSG